MIVGSRREIRSVGYNSFPRGINDLVESRQERPQKYFYFEHAERNAIYNATLTETSLNGCTCYLPFHPCADCARGLIQVGVVEVVCRSDVIPERSRDSCLAAVAMFSEAGVKVRLPNSNEDLVLKIGDEWGN